MINELDDDFDVSNEHDWEYMEEEIQREEQERRFASKPKLCQACRFYDWYYEDSYNYISPCTQGHNMDVTYQKGFCPSFIKNLPYFKPNFLWVWYLRLQYFLMEIYKAQGGKTNEHY